MSTFERGALAFWALVMAVAVFLVPADETSQANLVDRGCVIRFDEQDAAGNTVPRIHANSAHVCVGVSSVEVVGAALRVNLDSSQAVVDIQITEDETFTRLGISCGPSGGKGLVNVYCYDRTGVLMPADEIYAVNANLWFHVTSWVE